MDTAMSRAYHHAGVGLGSSASQVTLPRPARNPVKPSGRGFRAKFFSPKNRRHLRCESLLEFDCLHLFEFARGVRHFVEQPMTIRYRIASASRIYTPDFLVDWHDGERWFVEVKPEEGFATPKNQEKFNRLSDVFAMQGDRLVLLTEVHIRKSIRLRQIKRLLQVRNAGRESTSIIGCANIEYRTIAEALLSGVSMTEVLHRLALRDVFCSLDQEITEDTRLLPFEESHDDALFI